MPNTKVTLAPNAALDLVPADAAHFKLVIADTRAGITVASVPITEPPKPPGEPGGDNLIVNGKFQDASGAASLAGWDQDKDWFDTHEPRPDCLGTRHAQADRDFGPGVVNAWEGGNPSTASIWTETEEDLPEHSEVWLSWVCAHHMVKGSAVWELDGRSGPDEDWMPFTSYGIVFGVPGDKSCRAVPPRLATVNKPGGFRQYRLRATVTLADNRDGCIFGDVRLWVK